MRTALLFMVTAFALAACGGSDNRPVVVNPPAGSTVVVPQSGSPRVCPDGASTC